MQVRGFVQGTLLQHACTGHVGLVAASQQEEHSRPRPVRVPLLLEALRAVGRDLGSRDPRRHGSGTLPSPASALLLAQSRISRQMRLRSRSEHRQRPSSRWGTYLAADPGDAPGSGSIGRTKLDGSAVRQTVYPPSRRSGCAGHRFRPHWLGGETALARSGLDPRMP
jgi:hypothetical protein